MAASPPLGDFELSKSRLQIPIPAHKTVTAPELGHMIAPPANFDEAGKHNGVPSIGILVGQPQLKFEVLESLSAPLT